MVVGVKRSRREEKLTKKTKRCKVLPNPLPKVLSLLDITSKCVASLYPYQEIEEKLKHAVPFPVQTRIMFYSFPQNEICIELYSCSKIDVHETKQQPFELGMRLYEQDAVTDVLQIGFHLSGVVHEKIGICNRQKIEQFKCSMSFDRNCITSTECTCSTKNLLWCPHIVAVALYRIRNPSSVPIKQQVSDSIMELQQKDLQKLLLMLLSQNSNSILPSVQKLVDDLREPDSEITLLTGMPDPTAGGASEDENTWHINDENIRMQIKAELKEGRVTHNTIRLINKVREMMAAKDRNYLNLLKTITDTIFTESIDKPEIQQNRRTRNIYDELTSLWLCILLHPDLLSTTKNILLDYLKNWFKIPNCPKENADDVKSLHLLEDLMSQIEKEDSYVTKAGKIEALSVCKQHDALLKGAQDFLTNLKQSFNTFMNDELFMTSTDCIFTAFNTFLNHQRENEALELALISLSCSFNLPKGEYAQVRLNHRYERLIAQLELFDYGNTILQNTLITYGYKLYEKLSTLIAGTINLDILPNHCFARFLFKQLINIESSLAFKLALINLPMNLKKSASDDDDEEEISIADGASYNGSLCHISSHLEHQQGELAASILKQCDKYPDCLKLTLTSVLESITQPNQLLKLAKLCQSIAVSEHVDINILNAAFELGVRSVRLVTDVSERKTSLRWLVSCAVDTGRQAVDFLIRNWTDLFEAKEIANDVAPILTSQPVVFHLRLNTLQKREELFSNVRSMVIEACIKDPVSCVLFALTLCEEDHESFELVCQITSESSERFNTAQLFSVARYLECKKHLHRAFKIGVQALKKLDIGPLDCQHPAICDVLWISTLASNIGIDELTHIVPVIENCIHNPLLLTEIAERCANTGYTKNALYQLSCHKEPLNRLVASAQKLFIQDIDVKLRTITRKNYGDFTKYLQKIKHSFLLSEDGNEQFHWLIDYIMTSQKGKKKLHEVISEAFMQNA